MKDCTLSKLRYDPIRFLLSSRQPAWVKYQTLVRLLGRSQDDCDVCNWRRRRDTSALVANIRAKQEPEGWFPCMPWMHIHRYHFHRLVEMGYDIEDDTVRRTAEQLLDYQLPGGGYMHPTGPRVNTPDPRKGWAACMTGYVTKTLMDLGLENRPQVRKALGVMLNGQNFDGGWICQQGGPCVDESNCIISGSPWILACLVQARLISHDSAIAKKAVAMFGRFKKEVIRHGYMHDRCYRCDESLVLPSLHGLGMSKQHPLFTDLLESLIGKQQPDGSWLFRGNRSAWYTIEAIAVLQAIESV